MDRRQLLTGMMATAFVATIPVKAMAKLTTSVSPPMKRDFHVRYDSVVMTYLTKVLGRTEPFPHRTTMKTNDGFPINDRIIRNYADLLPPDPVLAAYYLEADRKDRLTHAIAEWDRVYTYKLS